MRILLVEDNADHRELMRLALTGHDLTWQVEGVVSGEEALCLLLGGEVFDLVFLDYSLPQRDGLWFLGEIRRGKASPPVVMVTGRGDEGVAVEAMKRGAYDYVVKQEGYLERLPVVARHAMEANRMALERKQAEEALKKGEERFRTSVETLLEGFAILSAVRDSHSQIIDFKYEYINKAGCKMNQKPHEEHMGKTLLELLPKHKEIGLFDEYVRVVETGQSLTKEFLIYETVYGSGERLRQAFDVRITRLGDGFVTTWQDITDKKKGAELLRQSEERLRLLIENSKDVVIMTDLEGSLIYYNGPPEYGITAEEVLGKNLFSIFEPVIAASLMNQLKLVIKGGEVLTFENVIPWKGESFWFLNQMYPIRDEKGRMITVGLIARNITERKRAEDEIKNLAKFPAESPFPILRLNHDGIILYGNEASELLLRDWGCEVGGYAPKFWRDLATEALTSQSRRTIGIGCGKQFYSFAVIPISDGGYINLYGIDITELKQMEEELIEREMFHSALFEYNPIQTIAVDLEGKVTGFNLAKKKSGDRLPNIGDVMYRDYAGRHEIDMYAELMKCIESGEIKEFPEQKYRGKILSITISPFSKGAVIISQDITERKQAEEALQASKELFEKTFISQRDAIFLSDAINPPTILDCNPAATEVFGYTRQEMVGRTMDFLYVDETAQKEFQGQLSPTIAERGFMHLFEFQMRRKDGKVFPTEHSVIPLADEQGERIGWVSVVRDITERKQSAERIHTYQEQLRSLASELSLIEERERRHIATELHDNISQTLAITKIKLGMAQGLTSPADWVGSLNEIGELIDQAIQYTRSLTFELSPPILYELGLEAGVEWLTEQIQEKHGIQIGFEDDRQPKPMNEEIRLTLFKTTRELLINIVKHAQASKAKVSIWREDNSIRIRVEDDGVGFSTSEGKELGKTTGFGLFNIRERMEYLRGDMVIESEPGRGTRVTLSAPLEEKED